MAGIEDIIAQITNDVKKEKDEMIKESDLQASSILNDAYKKANEMMNETNSLLEKEKAIEESKLQMKLQTTERDIILKSKQQYVNEVYASACDYISKLDKEEYLKIFYPLFVESINDRFLTEDSVKVIFAKNVSATHEDFFSLAKVLLEYGYTDKIKSGFIVITPEFEINCSGDELIYSSRQKTENEVISTLFA